MPNLPAPHVEIVPIVVEQKTEAPSRLQNFWQAAKEANEKILPASNVKLPQAANFANFPISASDEKTFSQLLPKKPISLIDKPL